MTKICSSIEELIGHTPLLEVDVIRRRLGLGARILAKLEFFNPGGSAKDRIAASMLDDAEKAGRLAPGGIIIEPTSGNTGIGLALLAAARGYRLIVTMPDNMSQERKAIMAALGAEIQSTPASLGMRGALEKAEELHANLPGSIIAGQFVNPANPAAHRNGTGPEIFEDTDGQVDMFVAGAGTGGTITGVGEYLKSRKPEVRIVAVEPATSAVLSGGKPGPHKIAGIGPGFVPQILNTPILDEVITVSDEDAFATARLLASSMGVLAGISSGAAMHAAIVLAKRPENENKTIVVLLPDTGTRYLSTGVFDQA